MGYFCHNIAQDFSHVVQHRPVSTLQISATTLDMDNISHQILQHSILPWSESIARATAELMQRMEWRKVAVLSSQSTNFIDTSFLKIADEYGIKVELEIETSQTGYRSPKQYIRELLKSGIKIVVAFVSPSEAIEILCTTCCNGFKWPDYAWQGFIQRESFWGGSSRKWVWLYTLFYTTVPSFGGEASPPPPPPPPPPPG